MTENEFSEAVEAAITVPSEQLRSRLFLESQACIATHDKTDTVPTLRLARILVDDNQIFKKIVSFSWLSDKCLR